MWIYYILYSLIISFPFFGEYFYKETDLKSRNTAIGITLVVVLVLGLRHPSMGIDLGFSSSYGYLASFKRISNFSWADVIQLKSYLNYEKGYIIFNKLISFISDDYQCLLFFSALLSIVPIGFVFYRYSCNQVLSWIMYLGLPCFLMTYSGLRQSIAIGICCFSLYYVEKKNKVGFVLTIAIASFFHSTAVVALLLYPLYWFKIDQSKRLATIIIPIICYIFKAPLFKTLYLLFKKNGEQEVQENGAITLFLVFMFIYLFCSVLSSDKEWKVSGFLNIFLIACCCQAFGGVNMLAQRVGFYFMPPIAIGLTNTIYNSDNGKTKNLMTLSIGCVFIVYGLYAIRHSTWQMAYPYHFFWSN